MYRFLQRLRKLDPVLLTSALLLVALGSAGISSTAARGAVESGLAWKHLVGVLLGMAAFFVVTSLSTEVLRRVAYPLYGFLLLVLTVVLFTDPIRGTKGWFTIGSFNLQPSELGKIIFLLIIAKYIAAVATRPSRFQFIAVSSILTLLPVGLILLQPDLGTALVYLVGWAVLLLLSGLKKRFVLGLFLSATLLVGVSWGFLLRDYQKERIVTFMNPEQDPLGAGYNLIQSKIAIGSGQIFGRGLGHGSQSQLRFLPEQHTDFIFALIAEELGFVGGGLLLALFLVLLLRGVKIAREARTEYGLMLAAGVVAMLTYQFLINVGMNMGLLPVTGVPLPFVSYGGTSMLTTWVFLGILQLVAQEGGKKETLGKA